MPVTLKPYNDRDTNAWRRRATVLILILMAVFCVPYGFYFALFAPYLVVQFLTPLAIMAVIAVWALPDMKRTPTGALPPLLFAFITVLILWPNYLAIALPGMPWITLLRLTSFPLTFILLVCVSVSAEFRAKLVAVLSATPMVWKALILLMLSQVFSLAFSPHPASSIQKIVVAQTSWMAVFFASCYVFLQPGRVQRFATLLWITAIIVGLVGLAEVPDKHVLWASNIPSFLKVGGDSVEIILAGSTRSGSDQYRVQSTFSTALGLAEFCSLTLPFVLHFIAGPFRPTIRAAAVASVPFILYVIIATDARLGLLGFFFSLMAYLFMWGLLRWTRSRANLIGPATVMAYPLIFTTFIAASIVVGRIRTRIWGGQYESSNEARLDQVSTGIPKILSHPFGHGIGEGGAALGYTTPSGLVTIDSEYLELAMDIGIPGLMLYITMLVSATVYATKCVFNKQSKDIEISFLTPLAVVIVNFMVIKLVFAQDDNNPIIFMVMGAIAALVYRAHADTKNDIPLAAAKPIRSFRRAAPGQ